MEGALGMGYAGGAAEKATSSFTSVSRLASGRARPSPEQDGHSITNNLRRPMTATTSYSSK